MVANGRDVHAVAHGVAAAVRGPFALGSHTVAMTASISVATSPPSDGLPVSGEELRKHVDLAMQAAKENGKDTITAFEPAMRTRLDTEMALRAELDKALADGALHVVYQPIVRLPCMEPAGVEALARWHHPVLGQVSPAEFIAVAERTGLIHSLGLFVLDRACEEFAAWDTEGSKYLSVNVSTLQLLDPGFPDRVSAVLHTRGVDPRRVVLEMTESVLADESQVTDALHALRSQGLRIAIDDFGTGYASLQYLRRLPVDVVKIDRSYVDGLLHDPQAKHFIGSLTKLFHGLGLSVVAEGVEQHGQSQELAALGVNLGQGYLYGRPMPAGQLFTPAPMFAGTADTR
jgi:EAL domain-containing protein (putative c-di-GMP-specific phosphodiesterase class I)